MNGAVCREFVAGSDSDFFVIDRRVDRRSDGAGDGCKRARGENDVFVRRGTSDDGRGREGGDEGTMRGGSKRNIFNKDNDIHEDESDADDDACWDEDDAKHGARTTNACVAADVDEDGRYRCGDER